MKINLATRDLAQLRHLPRLDVRQPELAHEDAAANHGLDRGGTAQLEGDTERNVVALERDALQPPEPLQSEGNRERRVDNARVRLITAPLHVQSSESRELARNSVPNTTTLEGAQNVQDPEHAKRLVHAVLRKQLELLALGVEPQFQHFQILESVEVEEHGVVHVPDVRVVVGHGQFTKVGKQPRTSIEETLVRLVTKLQLFSVRERFEEGVPTVETYE
jgi:hypothetical protein